MKGIKQLAGTKHTESVPVEVSPDHEKLKQVLLKDIKRSAYVYRVDCGGCNACEIEILQQQHRCTIPSVLGLKLSHLRGMLIFYSLPAR